MMMWPIEQPVAVVAPHLVHPAINGSDILLERVARYLSQHAPFVDLVGCHSVRRYRAAEVEDEQSFVNELRPRWNAATRTLLSLGHYYQGRFNTSVVKRVIHEQLGKEHYGIVLASYLTTLPLLPPALDGQRYFVWTLNDEFKWFEDLCNSTRSPLGKMVSRLSLQWLHREVPVLASKAVFIHVSKNDRDGFERVVPGHQNLVVPVGTDIDPAINRPQVSHSDRVIVSYIGSLGVRMAFDALSHFHDKFESYLGQAFDSKLVVRVIGSNPLPAVQVLCRKNGWELYDTPSDNKFSELLGESTFTILPFAYATGAKLKLIRSLGSGVPFLSTSAARPPDFESPPGSCFSDDPNDWVIAIRTWQAQPDLDTARQQLLAFAKNYSWPVVVANIARAIQQSPP